MSKHTPNLIPDWPIVQTTEHRSDGIDYAVYVADRALTKSSYEEGENRIRVWHRYVAFGSHGTIRAGGPDFQYAAREQERIAAEWAEKIGDE